MTITRNSLTVLALAAAASLAVCGCETHIDIVEYPPFQGEQLHTIVVLPLTNQTPHTEAGPIVTQALATSLRWNEAYRVVPPQQLQEMMRDAGMIAEVDGSGDPAAIAATLRKLQILDAFIVGEVRLYHTQAEYYNVRRSFWKYSAAATAQMTLYRVADAQPLYTTDATVWGRAESVGDPPAKSWPQLKAEAVDQLVRRLTKRIAPTHRQVKIDPDITLRTAGEIRNGEYAFTKRFTDTAATLYAVVELPPVADGNTFRVRVVRKDDSVELAGDDLLWLNDSGVNHLRFDPGRIARRGGGAGRYQVQLMSGDTPAVSVDIKIVAGDGSATAGRKSPQ